MKFKLVEQLFVYPKNSPITKFQQLIGNTKEDITTAAPSIEKAINNIEFRIKQELNLTSNTQIHIDKTKIIVLPTTNLFYKVGNHEDTTSGEQLSFS